METLYQVLGLMAGIFIVWYLAKTIKSRPDMFSKQNFSKSFYTMGLLALGLIAFIALLVLMLRG